MQPPDRTDQKTGYSALDAAVIVVIIVLGLVNLPMPFSGDQALATVIARGIGRGGVLYADSWDLRQPGVYLFHLAGGSLFGYSELGIHLFEVTYLTAFGIVLQVTLRGRFAHRQVASLVPLATVGVYWAAAGSWDLTQPEILVAFPLYVAMWTTWEVGGAAPQSARSRRLLLLSGLCAAAVVLFKLLYLPIVVGAWAIAARDCAVAMPAGKRLAPTSRMLAVIVIGLAFPLVAVVSWLATGDARGEAARTTFLRPWGAASALGRSSERVEDTIRHFLKMFGALTVAGALGAVTVMRRAPRPRLELGLAMWIGLGALLLAVQAWWPYQALLLVVPLGILSAHGVDRLLSGGAGRVGTAAAFVVLATLTLAPARELAHKARVLARHDFAIESGDRRALQDELQAAYRVAHEVDAILEAPGAAPGPIHVLGDPVYLYLSGRDTAVSVNGWAPELFDDGLWNRSADEIRERAPVYVYVDDAAAALIENRSAETAAALASEYCPRGRAGGGDWYGRLGTVACT